MNYLFDECNLEHLIACNGETYLFEISKIDQY